MNELFGGEGVQLLGALLLIFTVLMVGRLLVMLANSKSSTHRDKRAD